MGRYQCPRCATIVEAENPARLVCPQCGFGAAAPPAAGGPSYAPSGHAPPGYATAPPGQQAPPGYYGQPYQAAAAPPKTAGVAVAALVLGIVSLCIPLIIPSILAIVFGILGVRKANESPHTVGGKGLAIAGLVLGCVSLAIWLVWILLFPFVFLLNEFFALGDAALLRPSG